MSIVTANFLLKNFSSSCEGIINHFSQGMKKALREEVHKYFSYRQTGICQKTLRTVSSNISTKSMMTSCLGSILLFPRQGFRLMLPHCQNHPEARSLRLLRPRCMSLSDGTHLHGTARSGERKPRNHHRRWLRTSCRHVWPVHTDLR